MLHEIYFEKVTRLLNRIKDSQHTNMMKAGIILANTLEKDGLIHVFGCGHSHMISEELFYRAGGLVNVNAIFDTSIMLHEGAVKSSRVERMENLASLVLDRYKIGQNDCMIIASNSGINGYPIEMAISAESLGIPVICITSFEYVKEGTNHSSGKHLTDVCSLAIDNCVDKGDASITIKEGENKAGPLSSIALFFIANSVVLIAIDELLKRHITPKIFMSGNVEGGDDINHVLIKEKMGIIKHL